MVDGGEKTLETICEALKQKTPVVVIGGSGRVANFIEIAFEKTTNSKYVCKKSLLNLIDERVSNFMK